MIREMAHITVKPGAQAAFEAAVEKAQPLFRTARGCQRVELLHQIEDPQQYVLMVYWDTLEDHTVHFRESDAFPAWRALVSEFFAQPPHVVHVSVQAYS